MAEVEYLNEDQCPPQRPARQLLVGLTNLTFITKRKTLTGSLSPSAKYIEVTFLYLESLILLRDDSVLSRFPDTARLSQI